MGSKETACTNCIHREVCALKNDFLEAQRQVDEVNICKEEKDGAHSVIKLCNIPFIYPVELKCKYHYQETCSARSYDYATTAIDTRDYTGTPEQYILRG